MAKRIGKFNRYLRDLQNAMSVRKNVEVTNKITTSDRAHANLAMIKPVIDNNAANKFNTGSESAKLADFEKEYNDFIAMLKTQKDKEEAAIAVETEPVVQEEIKAEVVEEIKPEIVNEVKDEVIEETKSEIVEEVPVAKKTSTRKKKTQPVVETIDDVVEEPKVDTLPGFDS